ncbi:cytochrome c oxidase subunit 2 [Paenibacillaceae bacterium GAS479]|nr:cytochrome c oxidase subunit 2 [Paenibacillaceae bacterium GAS479]
MKWIMSIMLILAAALGIYMLTIGMPKPPQDETAGLPEGVELLKIVGTGEFKFDKPEYVVKAGQKYKMVLTNKGGIHGVGIKEFGIDLKDDKMEQEVVFDKPGRYELHCSVMCGVGHADMKSVLVVE